MRLQTGSLTVIVVEGTLQRLLSLGEKQGKTLEHYVRRVVLYAEMKSRGAGLRR